MEKFYIYILWSDSSQIYYVGFTSNFEARLDLHNHSEHNTFTSKHRPWRPKALFECGTSKARAMKIEKFIKAQKRSGFIEKLIDTKEFFGLLEALVRVPAGLIRGSTAAAASKRSKIRVSLSVRARIQSKP